MKINIRMLGVFSAWPPSRYLATSSFVQHRVRSEHRDGNGRTNLLSSRFKTEYLLTDKALFSDLRDRGE